LLVFPFGMTAAGVWTPPLGCRLVYGVGFPRIDNVSEETAHPLPVRRVFAALLGTRNRLPERGGHFVPEFRRFVSRLFQTFLRPPTRFPSGIQNPIAGFSSDYFPSPAQLCERSRHRRRRTLPSTGPAPASLFSRFFPLSETPREPLFSFSAQAILSPFQRQDSRSRAAPPPLESGHPFVAGLRRRGAPLGDPLPIFVFFLSTLFFFFSATRQRVDFPPRVPSCSSI